MKNPKDNIADNLNNDIGNDIENDIQYDYENNDKGFSAKKSLGQNFLHAPNIISAMVHAGKITKENIVLEVGPGKGALTEKLLETGVHIIAVEKDDRAIPFLQEKFKKEINNGQLEIVHGDILEFDESRLAKYILIANIPYYITGEFMRKFLETSNPPLRIVVMLQKEVAKRIVDTKESILSISVKVYGNPTYLCTVPRKFFRPIPNVDSAVLVIEDISKKFFKDKIDEDNIDTSENINKKLEIDEKYFFEVIKKGFAHKRKVLIKNLEEIIPRERLNMIWKTENIDKNARAEDLSTVLWKKIIGNN
jgi:16S rRNA (adenine1518-N6/adenine1519-N6)-dimethyltransferase